MMRVMIRVDMNMRPYDRPVISVRSCPEQKTGPAAPELDRDPATFARH